MRVVTLGIFYGAILGVVSAALFGLGIAVFGPSLGLNLPHNLAGQAPLDVVQNTAYIGLTAGLLGGFILSLVILGWARGNETRGRWIGAISALLPLVWLPYFATRGLLRRGVVTGEDVLFFVLLVLLPLIVAAWAGMVMGRRLARVARL